ncbi:hypothetical protein [Devriesea agamarum]|uniref:hypothetical protein n=1 Tax=Devriesea agamarum TaxID=472569 RepID=UPI0012EDE5AD|nr:hypothetical protein [Devriesea agamarum]
MVLHLSYQRVSCRGGRWQARERDEDLILVCRWCLTLIHMDWMRQGRVGCRSRRQVIEDSLKTVKQQVKLYASDSPAFDIHQSHVCADIHPDGDVIYKAYLALSPKKPMSGRMRRADVARAERAKMGIQDRQSYLSSPAWRGRRQRFLRDSVSVDGMLRCACCSQRRWPETVEVYHRHYAGVSCRGGRWRARERDEDLRLVCCWCLSFIYMAWDEDPNWRSLPRYQVFEETTDWLLFYRGLYQRVWPRRDATKPDHYQYFAYDHHPVAEDYVSLLIKQKELL